MIAGETRLLKFRIRSEIITSPVKNNLNLNTYSCKNYGCGTVINLPEFPHEKRETAS